MGELHQTFKEELIPIILKLFQKNSRIFLDLFNEASITLIYQSQRHRKKRKLEVNIPDEYRWKTLQQNISKLILREH